MYKYIHIYIYSLPLGSDVDPDVYCKKALSCSILSIFLNAVAVVVFFVVLIISSTDIQL